MQANARMGGGGIFQRGPIGILIIAAHVLVIYVAAMSMGIVKIPSFVKPMEAIIIDVPDQTKVEPVQVIKPDLTEPVVEDQALEDSIPPIEVPTDEPAPTAITAETAPPKATETANMKVNSRVDPVYPPASRRAGEEGTGMFRVLVNERGQPIEVSVLRSSGFPRLDEAAIAAIRRWVFSPALQNSQPVQSWTRVKVTFKLDNA